MSAYSFLDVSLSIEGPGGLFAIDGTGNAEEGFTIEPVGDKNTMTPGSDGTVMHSLAASTASTLTIKMLKTSPTNALLMSMYNFQKGSSSRWGQNNFVARNSASGDIISLQDSAFKKVPALTYAKEGGMVEWAFDCGETSYVLGGATLYDSI